MAGVQDRQNVKGQLGTGVLHQDQCSGQREGKSRGREALEGAAMVT